MKLALKIFAGFILFIILLVVSLNLWFTDERLKGMIEPRIAESLNHEVEIDHMSLTLFRTFPNLGLEIDGFRLPKADGESDISVERIISSVSLLPLFNQNIEITRLIVDNPRIVYTLYADSTTSLDFLFEEEPVPQEDESDISLQIPRFQINNANIEYRDEISDTRYSFSGLNSGISIDYDETLESVLDADLESLVYESAGSVYSPGVPLSLHQVVSIDPERSTATLADGLLTVRGLSLNLSGTIDYSRDDSQLLNLEFSSSTDNFADLIELLPPQQRDHLGDTEVSGSLQFEGSLSGIYSANEQPDLNLLIAVTDGFLNNPEIREPLRNITLALTATNERVSLQNLSLELSGNGVELSGYLDEPFSETPVFHFDMSGNAVLNDIPKWYPMEPYITEMAGSADIEISVNGPVGEFSEIVPNGRLVLENVEIRGDSLSHPVTNLTAVLTLSPSVIELENYSMLVGSSDYNLEGALENWLTMIAENVDGEPQPILNGSYTGTMLNLDEMFDWDFNEEDDTEYLINLPDLTSSLSAQVDTMVIMGVNVTNLGGSARTTPVQMEITQAEASLFDGGLTGTMTWAIPEPDQSSVHFNGNLAGVQIQTLFDQFPILGRGGRLQEFATGLISADVDYYTELNSRLDPDVSSMRAAGNFGVGSASISGHPIQVRLAQWLGADELNNLQLDDWQAEFTVENSEFIFENLQITSDNIGLQLSGTHHLESDEIDFTASITLPGRFSGALGSVLPARAVERLTREDGMIVVPVQMAGTMNSPRISPRQQIIDELLRETATDAARNILNRLFNGN